MRQVLRDENLESSWHIPILPATWISVRRSMRICQKHDITNNWPTRGLYRLGISIARGCLHEPRGMTFPSTRIREETQQVRCKYESPTWLSTSAWGNMINVTSRGYSHRPSTKKQASASELACRLGEGTYISNRSRGGLPPKYPRAVSGCQDQRHSMSHVGCLSPHQKINVC